MAMQNIPDSTYFKKRTEALRSPILSKNIMFGDKGLIYKSDKFAFGLFRPSKNHYYVIVFQPGIPVEEYDFTNLHDAIEFVIEIVKLDKSGN